MGSLNDKSLGTTSPCIAQFRRTPVSNNITQFLSPVSHTSSASRMSNILVSTDGRTLTTPKTAAEKKNAKVKRVEIDDDIEMLEPESEVENGGLAEPAAEETSLATLELSTSSGKENQEVIDINDDTVSATTQTSGCSNGGSDVASTAPKAAAEKKNAKVKRVEIDVDIEMVEADSDEENVVLVEPAGKEASHTTHQSSTFSGIENEVIDINDDDDIVSSTPTSCSGGNTVDPKMKKIKQTNIDDDIEVIEEDVSGQLGAIPEAYNTAETPSELQRSNSVMSENSLIVLSPNYDTHGLGAGTRTPNGVVDNQEEESSSIHQSVNATSRRPKKRTSTSTSFREVLPADWRLGYDKRGAFGKRVIVFEENDRNYAREYLNADICKRCHGCYRVQRKTVNLKWNEGNQLCAPTNHICKPRLYSEIEQEQLLLQENTPSRRRAATTERGSKRQRIDIEAMRDESDDPIDYASQEDSNINNDWNEFIEPSTPPSNFDPIVSPPIASPNQVPSPPLSDENDSELNTSFPFYHPSGYFINECCEKLELAYQFQAYRFWANIKISHLRPTSVPQITHTTADQQSSGFASISLLMTGSETHTLYIKNKLNTYFLLHSAEIGDIVGQSLTQTFNPKVIETLSSNDLTDIHFVAIAHWFECRIALFKDGSWKRFGKWQNSPDLQRMEYVPMIVMESRNGKYSPIFTV